MKIREQFDFSVYIGDSGHKFDRFEKLNCVNSFYATGLFLHPQQTWENLSILIFLEVQKDHLDSDVFRGTERDQRHEMG